MTQRLYFPSFLSELRVAIRVLVVDDVVQNRTLLERMLSAEGYRVTSAADGAIALRMVEAEPPDLIVSDIDMPNLDGIEFCRKVKENPLTRLVPFILITGLADRANRIAGIEAGADDFLGKPFDSQELKARVRSLLRLKRYTDELDSAESVILSLALTVEARDPYTRGHCQRLAAYAGIIGERIGASDEQLSALHRGGYLHDVGKIGVPDAVLFKPTGLTPEEYEVLKRHTVIGDRLCGDLRALSLVRPIVRHHHERLDGSGYPDGLRGDAVPLLAQIIAIVDEYDAITTSRPYRLALPPERAFDELAKDVKKGLLNPDLVEIFSAVSPEVIAATAAEADALAAELTEI
ncbi:MAG TPA: HD domain-containing phosphohydrolase [Vicinamibacterales bacterium]|nr:HD domain-containing phosphohydrolase [Vicinamibacterales bacterium]